MATISSSYHHVGRNAKTDAVVLTDVHAPLHDEEWLERVIAFAEVAPDAACILGGDTCDYASLSFHPPYILAPSQESEEEAAREVISRLAEVYKDVYVFLGNHEFRAAKKLGLTSSLIVRHLLNGLPDNVHGSPFWYCWLNDSWFVCHPDRYSKLPLTIAAKVQAQLSEYEGELCSVITGHEHHRAFAQKANTYLINNPTLQDPEKTPYLQFQHNATKGYPPWSQGFTHVRKDGTFRLYGDEDIPFLDALR